MLISISLVVLVSFQINPKTWPSLKIDDIIEITTLGSTNTTNSVDGSSGIVNSSSNVNTNSAGGSGGVASSGIVGGVTGASASSSSSSVDDETPSSSTSPFLLQVVSASFTDNLPIDTIRIDQAACAAPFFIKNFGFVIATKVEKSVTYSVYDKKYSIQSNQSNHISKRLSR